MASTTTTNARSKPHPFTKTSPGPIQTQPSSPLSESNPAGADTLAIDASFHFVETTSQVAAAALAKFYSDQGEEEYAVLSRVDSKGRKIYRIRPRSRPATPVTTTSPTSPFDRSTTSSPIFARASVQPPAPPPHQTPVKPQPLLPSINILAPTPTQQSKVGKGLRSSKSIPVLRFGKDASSPTTGPSTTTTSAPAKPKLVLRKSGSTPTLSTAFGGGSSDTTTGAIGGGYGFGGLGGRERDGKRSQSHSGGGGGVGVGGGSQVDVLGKLLGWTDVPFPVSLQGQGIVSGGTPAAPFRAAGADGGRRRQPRFREGGASARMPKLPSSLSSGAEVAGAGSVVSAASAESGVEGDMTDLPRDLVEELDSMSEAGDEGDYEDSLNGDEDEEGQLPRAPPVLHHQHPFGSGVRVPSASRRGHGTEESLAPTGSGLGSGSSLGMGMEKTMREVSSSDSIRTAKAEPLAHSSTPTPTHSPHPRVKPAKRFQDPAVFDVFQQLDSLSFSSSPSAAQSEFQPRHSRLLSTSTVSSASDLDPHDIVVSPVPGDDPRFVIWGLKEPEARHHTSLSNGPDSPKSTRRGSVATDVGTGMGTSSGSNASSPATSTSSKRWSLKDRRSHSNVNVAGAGEDSSTPSPSTSTRDSVSSGEAPQRVLMAATVERWIAELTSQIRPELLIGFFLTFRTFVRPLDLLRLLLTRFDWAMQDPSSPEDDAGRRIVRVRTFVVVRHWLLNHFGDDFVPDRKLRTALTDWLNERSRDEVVRRSPKDHRLIKGLKKIVRRLKETHVAIAHVDPGARTVLLHSPLPPNAIPSSPGGREPSDEDVDLEINYSQSKIATSTPLSSVSRTRSRFEATFSRLTSSPNPSSSSSARSNSEFSSTLRTTPSLSFPLPNSQNAIARSFTSALGTFGRFKRMLGNRATVGGANALQNVFVVDGGRNGTQLELEESTTGDLLYAKQGLASFLEYYNIPLAGEGSSSDGAISSPMTATDSVPTPGLDDSADSTTDDSMYNSEGIHTPSDVDTRSFVDIDPTTVPEHDVAITGLGISTEDHDRFTPTAFESHLTHSKSNQTIKTTFVDNQDEVVAASPPVVIPAPQQPPTFALLDYHPADPRFFGARPQSARIELDDVDLSDEDEDVVEVKRTLKRLPAAHNLRVATTLKRLAQGPNYRQSVDTVSSYGSPTRVSYGGPERDSIAFVDVDETNPAGVQVVENFVLEGIDSDDDEPGDVEAALRRLEGFLDDDQEREKAKRVARQMEKSQKLALEKKIHPPTAEVTDEEECGNDVGEVKENDAASISRSSVSTVPSSQGSSTEQAPAVIPVELARPASSGTLVTTTTSTVTTGHLRQDSTTTKAPSRTQSRSFSRRAGNARVPASKIFSPRVPSMQPTAGPAPPTHRSFILHCRTEVLAQQFCLIERDMFRLLTWQELVGGGWRDPASHHSNVLDWELYIKERRKLEMAAKDRGDNTPVALQAMIARYNLTSNWVASEIVLTVSVDERAALIAKFIRLAFKCYCQNNFQTMTQIIHGLGVPDIERLKRTWARVPAWEMRKFRGMKTFVSATRNFKHLRAVQNALIADHGPAGQFGAMSPPPLTHSSRPSVSKASKALPPPVSCLPFLGIFLKDLSVLNDLPTFLNPSAPGVPADVDGVGNLTSQRFDNNTFSNLPALPEGMPLRPLVNVHKFRMVADVVQLVIAFQEFAEKFHWNPDSGLYLKVLKIKCLDSDTLRECSLRLVQE
ncbi:ras GEF [Meredithblackwellia eburnea MCA 4105]